MSKLPYEKVNLSVKPCIKKAIHRLSQDKFMKASNLISQIIIEEYKREYGEDLTPEFRSEFKK
jgi:hypothetical protein